MNESAAERSRASRARLIVIAALVLLPIAALAWLFTSVLRPYRPGEATGDDLDIRLVGVWHRNYDDVFDASGEKIGETLGTAGYYHRNSPDELKRAFILEVPALAPDVFECPFLEVHPTGRTRRLLRAYLNRADLTPRAWVHADLPSTYTTGFPADWLPLRPNGRQCPVERVDVTLRYWSGPRGAAEHTFEGPFEPGKAVAAVGDASVTARLARFYETGSSWGTFMEVSGTTPGISSTNVLVYDADGRRHYAYLSKSAFFRVHSVAPEDITAVTIGEERRERTFHNVKVVYPDVPEREYPLYRDLLEEQCGLPAVRAHFGAGDMAEAASIIGIVRGQDIMQAYYALRSELRTATEMADEHRAQIVTAVEGWSESDDEEIRMAGFTLALHVDFDRFIDRALAFIIEADMNERTDVMQSLARNAEKLSPAHLARIRDILLTATPRLNASILLICLEGSPLPEAAEALVDLATDERSLLWSRPLQQENVVAALGPCDGWPTQLKARRLVANGFGSLDEADTTAALELLPSMLTEDLENTSESAARSIITLIAGNFDRETAMEVFARHLENKKRFTFAAETVGLIARYVNLWNGVDIGGLGADVESPVSHPHERNWREVSDAVLDWHRTGTFEPRVPEGYRVQKGDLRIVLYNTKDPGNSLIGLWRGDGRTDRLGGQAVLETDALFFGFSIIPLVTPIGAPVGPGDDYSLRLSLETSEGGFSSGSSFEGSAPPCVAFNYGDFRVHIEPADSPTSAASGTKVFDQWWEKYGTVSDESEQKEYDEQD